MAKRKKEVYFVGQTSFTKEGYDEFTKKSKKEQVEQVYNSLSPKDYNEAERILKNVPNGNIGSGNAKEDEQDNGAGIEAGSNSNSGEGRGAKDKKAETK